LTGFCPDGPFCDLAHPKFDLLPEKLRIRPDRPINAPKKENKKSILEIQIEEERKKEKVLREQELQT
jgi:cleavage and polyadenylation specificity factor subunit 4